MPRCGCWYACRVCLSALIHVPGVYVQLCLGCTFECTWKVSVMLGRHGGSCCSCFPQILSPGLTARHSLIPQPSGHSHLQQLSLLWHERKQTWGIHSEWVVNWALHEVFHLLLPCSHLSCHHGPFTDYYLTFFAPASDSFQ